MVSDAVQQNPNIAHSPEVHEAIQGIEAFVSNEEVLKLAESFGFEVSDDFHTKPLRDRLMALKELSNAFWDYRKGGERWEAQDVNLDAIAPQILRASASLDMVGSTQPKGQEYDVATVLGGAGITPIARIEYAKEMMDAHGTKPRVLVLLGSQRALDPKINEENKVAFYAPGAKTEFDLMCAGAEKVFGVSSTGEETMSFASSSMVPEDGEPIARAFGKDWKVRYYETEDGMPILAISAPVIEGNGRANTADTYRFAANILGDVISDPATGGSAKVLNITNSRFIPFQNFDAERLIGIPNGATVETIGFDGRHYEGHYPPIQGDASGKKQGDFMQKPQDLVQEINSAVNQAALLLNYLETK